MEVIIAKHSGFCEGVGRAYRIALEKTSQAIPVFMLGNIVHNKQVVEKFEKLGARTVKDLSEIPNGAKGTLIISAHGVPPDVYRAAEVKGLEIVDTTCPWVKKAQRIAKELNDEGRTVVIVGDKGHPEVKGLIGWSGGSAKVIEDIRDIRSLGDIKSIKGIKVGILAQTTQAEEHFRQMVRAVKEQAKDVKEFDTICGATSKRQEAAVTLAKTVDLMLVIGDKMSANTKRLAELCAKTGTLTHQIQTVKELDKKWLADKKRIGITAGASTPDWVVNEITSKLWELKGN